MIDNKNRTDYKKNADLHKNLIKEINEFFKDGKKNKVLNKKIYHKLNVTMVHGDKDESVPVSYSRKILTIFKNSKKKLVIVKNGNHSLSSIKCLKILKKELKLIAS